ncbi:MAG TPA: patatin-like phospholipase family protein [Dysgonamonadaceae bacterium]|nr:patatin-like phospholipase family protein [Dysgonamonadaceae bacterium]
MIFLKNLIKQSIVASWICLVFVLVQPLQAQTVNTEDEEEIKLGLVLSGGGAKGFAHIGALKVFEEENIPITLITGNSIGTIVGALYSLGYSAQDIEDFTREQDWEMLLLDEVPRKLQSPFKQDFEHKYLLQLNFDTKDRKLSLPSGYVKGNNILNLFSGITANISDSVNFSDLPIPFSCVAYNIGTGKEEVLSHGHLPTAMLSSMAFPGALSPVSFNDMLLVDGGVINNFPVDVAKNMGADIIIGVDLKQVQDQDSNSGSITSILMGIINQIEVEKHNKNIELADVVINPKLDGISTFDFKASVVDSVMKQGERAAREQMPKIRELIAGRNIKRNNKDLTYNHNDEWLIKDVIIDDDDHNESKFINFTLNITPNTLYTTKELDEAVKRVYAYGNFEMVNYKLKPNGEGYNLELIIKDKKESKLMLGAGFNTVNLAAIYANYSKQNYSNFFSLMMIDTKIAVNPQMKLKMETNRAPFSTIGFEVSSRYNRLNLYEQGSRSGKIDIVNVAASLYTNKRFQNTIDMGLGMTQHYFNGNTYSRNANNLNTLFDADADGFYSTLFGQFTIDSRDNVYLPKKGLYLNTRFSLLANKGDFTNIVPIYYLKLNSVVPLDENVSLLADFHHRTLFNTTDETTAYANYAANVYNSYSYYSFPVLGQRGMSFLDHVSTMGELGLRIKLDEKHFFTPRLQALLQFDEWKNFGFDNLNWSAGISYQTTTILGPVEFTLGYQNDFSEFNFFGGVGYQF